MTRRRRWALVVLLVATLAALPFIVRALPVSPVARDTSAAVLLERVRHSATRPYAGYAETTGSLVLPVSGQFDSVASLFGGRTQQRIWWRAADDWRADTLGASGERSTRVSPTGTWVWDFEDNRATRTGTDDPGTVRLPQDSDTLPPPLGARLLSGAAADEVSTLPARRVAGRAADGLRLTPNDPLSSIGRVDVWVDRASGIPLFVSVFARGASTSAVSSTAAVSSTFLDFTDERPTAAATTFRAPPGSRVRTGNRLDLVRAVGRFAAIEPPASLLGFPRATPPPGTEGIGQYGHGVTQVAVGSLPGRLTRSLRTQLQVAGATPLPEGLAISVGPIGLLLTGSGLSSESWLVTGTLTPQGLARAATELAAATVPPAGTP